MPRVPTKSLFLRVPEILANRLRQRAHDEGLTPNTLVRSMLARRSERTPPTPEEGVYVCHVHLEPGVHDQWSGRQKEVMAMLWDELR